MSPSQTTRTKVLSGMLIFSLVFGLVFLGKTHEMEAQIYRVVIDPGHGGRDRGSIHGKLYEAQLNLSIALLLKQRLEKEKDIQPLLTRDHNKTVSLKERIQFVHKSKVHFLISLHVNSLHQVRSKVQGMEIYVASPPILKKQQMSLLSPHSIHHLRIPSASVPPASASSTASSASKDSPHLLHSQDSSLKYILQDLQIERRFLYSIQLSKSLYRQWSPVKRPIRHAPFFILTQSPVPAVLIEMGFLSNREERTRLQQKDYQEKIAAQIHQGLLDFKKILDKDRTSL